MLPFFLSSYIGDSMKSANQILLEITNNKYLSINLMRDIEEYTESFKNTVVSDEIRKRDLIPLLSSIKEIQSEDNFFKGRIYAYIEKLINRGVKLKSESEQKTREVSTLLQEVMKIKKVEIVRGFNYQGITAIQLLDSKMNLSKILSELKNNDYTSMISNHDDWLNLNDFLTQVDFLTDIHSQSDSTLSNKLSLYSTPESVGGSGDIGEEEGIYQEGAYSSVLDPFFKSFSEKLSKIEYLVSVLNQVKFAKFIVTDTSESSRFWNKVTKLLIHISKSYSDNDDWIPISKEFLRRSNLQSLISAKIVNTETGEMNSTLYVLSSLGLVEIKSYDRIKGLSRELKLTKLGLAITGLLSLEITRIKGTPVEEQPGDLSAEAQDWNFYSDEFIPEISLITKTLKSLSRPKVHLSSYIADMKELNPILAITKDEYCNLVLENVREIEEGTIQIDFKGINNFHKDLYLLTTGKNVKRDKNGNWYPDNTFTLSYTGRLFSRYGVQGLTKISKSVVHEGKYNYDIANSQIAVLLLMIENIYLKFSYQWTKEELDDYSNIKTLIDYHTGKLTKEGISEEIGLSVEDWKKCLYTLVFGGSFSNSAKTSIGVVIQNNLSNPNFSEEKLKLWLEKFRKPIKLWLKYCQRYALFEELNEYEVDLLKSSFKHFFKDEVCDPDEWCFNGVIFLNKSSRIFQEPAKLSAYFLQGTESAFIYQVMTDSRSKQLKPLSYEFDGLVVQNEIPSEVIVEARKKSKFLNASVKVKSFRE